MAATAATASTFATAQADDKAPGASSSIVDRRDPGSAKGGAHDLEGPYSEQQDAQRQAALEQVIAGDKKVSTRNGSKVVKLDDKKYVELGREKTDKIFTVLVEFGDKVDDTTMIDPDGDGPKPPVKKYGGTPGPLHNTIAKPDPAKDNSTAWQADYNQAHFQDLYFGEGSRQELAEDVLREDVLRALLGRRRGLRLGQGPVQRGPLRLQLLRLVQLRQLLGHDQGRRERLGGRPEGQGPHAGADQGGPGELRPVGPLRLRQRRQLQRARRLHRPLPDRARR